MNRREVLLLLAGTAAVPDRLLAIGRTVHQRVRAGTLRALNPHQNETIATIVERIIHKTATPPARHASLRAHCGRKRQVGRGEGEGDDRARAEDAPTRGGAKARNRERLHRARPYLGNEVPRPAPSQAPHTGTPDPATVLC